MHKNTVAQYIIKEKVYLNHSYFFSHTYNIHHTDKHKWQHSFSLKLSYIYSSPTHTHTYPYTVNLVYLAFHAYFDFYFSFLSPFVSPNFKAEVLYRLQSCSLLCDVLISPFKEILLEWFWVG